MWIYGLKNQVCLRVNALPELNDELNKIHSSEDNNDPVNMMVSFMEKDFQYFGSCGNIHMIYYHR